MNELTISQIKHFHRKLELDIAALLIEFKDTTGLLPKAVSLDIVTTGQLFKPDNNQRFLNKVRVEITI